MGDAKLFVGRLQGAIVEQCDLNRVVGAERVLQQCVKLIPRGQIVRRAAIPTNSLRRRSARSDLRRWSNPSSGMMRITPPPARGQRDGCHHQSPTKDEITARDHFAGRFRRVRTEPGNLLEGLSSRPPFSARLRRTRRPAPRFPSSPRTIIPMTRKSVGGKLENLLSDRLAAPLAGRFRATGILAIAGKTPRKRPLKRIAKRSQTRCGP